MNTKHTHKAIAIGTALLLGALVFGGQLYAGSGTINVDEKKINLNVFFTYQETDENLEGTIDPTWKKVFNEASKRLWNATNGQLRIGKVTVYLRALSRKDDGDAWIGKGNRTAYATGYEKMGDPNHHMMFYAGTHRSLNAAYQGDLSIVHELGHYTFGLVDQYIGAKVRLAKKDSWTDADLVFGADGNFFQKNDYICSVPHDHAQVNHASIMDAGGGVNNSRTEFDTAGNTNKGRSDGTYWYMQAHWLVNKESCWESLGKFKWNGTTVFPNVPAGDSPTDMPAGFTDIEFEVVPTLYRLALCIDRSGSMSQENRMILAKQGAAIFTNLLQPKHEIKMYEGTANEELITIDGDNVSVVSFNSRAVANLAMAEVDKDGAVKTQARTAVAALYPSGSTAIGEGTQLALTQISGQGDPVSGEVIILLSDGYNNSGSTSPAEAAVNAKTRGAKIYSIGLGGADSGTLGSMARTTGGKYYHASDALGLLAIYPQIYSELKGGGLVEAIGSLLREKSSEKQTVLVEEATEEITFAITSPDEGWKFAITSPSGKTYTGSDEAAGVLFEDNNSELHYLVTAPQAGEWTLDVAAPESDSGKTYQYNLIAGSSTPKVSVTAKTDKLEYTYPDKALISCNVVAIDPVAGAQVIADVTGPDGIIGKLTLYDDGEADHGDEFANDGTYSAYFGAYTGSGLYTLDINVVAKDAKAGIAIPEKSDKEEAAQDIPDFTRSTSVTFEAKDVPDVSSEWLRVDALQLVVNKKDPSLVSLKMAFALNAPAETFKPGNDDITITVGSTVVATIPATAFSKAGKKGDNYKIKDKASGISGILKSNIGGSSLSSVVAVLKNVINNGLILPTTSVNVQVKFGNFDETVSLSVPQHDSKLVYSAKKNFCNTPALYVDGLKIVRDSGKANSDSIRLVATFAGGAAYNPAIDSVTFNVGSYQLVIPAGSLKTNKKGTVAKGKVEISNPDGSKGTVNVTIKLDQAIISIKGSKLDIAAALQNIEICSLELGTFKKAALLSFSLQDKKSKRSYEF